jgi:Uma2 family endonuclease
MPPARPEHQIIVARLAHWFHTHGFGPEQIIPDCGIDVGGGRQPDLTVWGKDQPPRSARSVYAGLAGLQLIIEVVSPDSETIDRVIKRDEYAAAGAARYWIVGKDKGNTVHMLALAGPEYQVEREVPLDWLLNEPPPDLT